MQFGRKKGCGYNVPYTWQCRKFPSRDTKLMVLNGIREKAMITVRGEMNIEQFKIRSTVDHIKQHFVREKNQLNKLL